MHRLNRSAFSLIELIAVIVVVVLLASIIATLMHRMRAKSHAVQCGSNLRQIGLAVQSYSIDNNGKLPSNDPWNHPTEKQSWQMKLASYAGIDEGMMGLDDLSKVRSAGVFACPNLSPITESGIPKREFPYGWNPYVRGTVSRPWELELFQFAEPANTFLIVEGEKEGETIWPHEIRRRHTDNTANYLFFDMHVEMIRGEVSSSDRRWRDPALN